MLISFSLLLMTKGEKYINWYYECHIWRIWIDVMNAILWWDIKSSIHMNRCYECHIMLRYQELESQFYILISYHLMIANLHDDKTWYYVFHAMSWTNITNTWLWYFSFLLMTKGEKYDVMHKFMHKFMMTCCKYSWWILQWLEFRLNSRFYQYGILIGGVCLNSKS